MTINEIQGQSLNYVWFFPSQSSIMANFMFQYHMIHVSPRHWLLRLLIVNMNNVPNNVIKNIVYKEVFKDIPTPLVNHLQYISLQL